MEFTNNGIKLTSQEAIELSTLFAITGNLDYSSSPLPRLVRMPSDEERTEARELAHVVHPRRQHAESPVLIDQERYGVVATVIRLALDNKERVTYGLNESTFGEDFDRLPNPADDALDLAEEISAGIQERSTDEA